jgi:hypothetical protein
MKAFALLTKAAADSGHQLVEGLQRSLLHYLPPKRTFTLNAMNSNVALAKGNATGKSVSRPAPNEPCIVNCGGKMVVEIEKR